MTLEAPVRKSEDEDDQAIKERHLKRLKELSEKSLGEVPQLDKPTNEQKEWMKRRMRGSARSWEVYNQ